MLTTVAALEQFTVEQRGRASKDLTTDSSHAKVNKQVSRPKRKQAISLSLPTKTSMCSPNYNKSNSSLTPHNQRAVDPRLVYE
jgi:hypothetical protein